MPDQRGGASCRASGGRELLFAGWLAGRPVPQRLSLCGAMRTRSLVHAGRTLLVQRRSEGHLVPGSCKRARSSSLSACSHGTPKCTNGDRGLERDLPQETRAGLGSDCGRSRRPTTRRCPREAQRLDQGCRLSKTTRRRPLRARHLRRDHHRGRQEDRSSGVPSGTCSRRGTATSGSPRRRQNLRSHCVLPAPQGPTPRRCPLSRSLRAVLDRGIPSI
jgi:hypothetical protein